VRRGIAVALLGLLLGCDDGRLAELEAEVEALEEKRVPVESVEKAKAEAAQAEAELTALARTRDLAEARERDNGVHADTLAKMLEAEQDRMLADAAERDALLSGTTALRERLEARRRMLSERRGALDAHRSDLRRACERVVEVASQIRATDPEWATARRIAVLDELLRQVAEQEPGDREIRSISMAPAGGDRIREARARAERLRARLVALYAPGAGAEEGACPVTNSDAGGGAQTERPLPER